jgi:predicted NAD/FAD-dependent oxidoreductase
VRVRKGLYVAGDHLDNGSINGALASGRRAAAALLEDL